VSPIAGQKCIRRHPLWIAKILLTNAAAHGEPIAVRQMTTAATCAPPARRPSRTFVKRVTTSASRMAAVMGVIAQESRARPTQIVPHTRRAGTRIVVLVHVHAQDTSPSLPARILSA